MLLRELAELVGGLVRRVERLAARQVSGVRAQAIDAPYDTGDERPHAENAEQQPEHRAALRQPDEDAADPRRSIENQAILHALHRRELGPQRLNGRAVSGVINRRRAAKLIHQRRNRADVTQLRGAVEHERAQLGDRLGQRCGVGVNREAQHLGDLGFRAIGAPHPVVGGSGVSRAEQDQRARHDERNQRDADDDEPFRRSGASSQIFIRPAIVPGSPLR